MEFLAAPIIWHSMVSAIMGHRYNASDYEDGHVEAEGDVVHDSGLDVHPSHHGDYHFEIQPPVRCENVWCRHRGRLGGNLDDKFCGLWGLRALFAQEHRRACDEDMAANFPDNAVEDASENASDYHQLHQRELLGGDVRSMQR